MADVVALLIFIGVPVLVQGDEKLDYCVVVVEASSGEYSVRRSE